MCEQQKSKGVRMILDGKLYLYLAIFVASLRSYLITRVGNFNLSFFRFFLILSVFMEILSLLKFKAKLSSMNRVNFILTTLSLLLFALSLSVLTSSNIYEGDSISRFLVKLIGFLYIIYFSIAFSKKSIIKSAIKVYLLSSIIPLMIGMYQVVYFLIHHSFPLLPFSRFSVIEDETSKALGTQYWIYPRITSTFLEPNYFGLFLTSIIIMSISLLSREGNKTEDILPRIVLWTISLFSLFELMFTLSLSAMTGFIVGVLVYILLSKLKFVKLVRSSFAIVILLLVADYLFSFLLNINIFQMVNDRIFLRMQSMDTLYGRKEFFSAAFKAFAKNPLIGVGFGGLFNYIRDISPVSSAHNAFLTFLAEQGLLGFIPLVFFYIYITYRIYVMFKYFSHQGDIQMAQIGIGLLSYLIASVIASQFYDEIFYFDTSWTLIAISTSYAVLNPLDLKGELKHD